MSDTPMRDEAPPLLRIELVKEKAEAQRPGIQGSLEAFLRTALGGALLGFLFTGVLGAGVTAVLSNAAKERAEKTASIAKRAADRQALNATVGDDLVERQTRGALVASAIANRMSDEDVKRRWIAYENAYVRYNAFVVGAQPRLDALGLYGQSSKFSRFLSSSITPGFSRIDSCITRAYGLRLHERDDARDRRRVMDAAFPRLDPAQPGELVCGIRRAANGLSAELWTASSERKRLTDCSATWQRQLRDIFWLSDRLDEQRDRGWFARFARTWGEIPKRNGCKGHDYACHLDKAWDTLEAEVAAGCGQLKDTLYKPARGGAAQVARTSAGPRAES